MRLDKTLIAAVVVSLVAGLFWWAESSAARAKPSGTESPLAQSVEPSAAPKALNDNSQKETIQHLEARLKMLEMQAQHPAPPGSASPIEESDDTISRRSAPSTDPRVAAKNKAKIYDDALGSESVDREWSSAMQTRIQEFFRSDKAVGSSVQRIECRSTMCRVDIASQSKAARQAFTQTMTELTPPGSQGFAHIDTDESIDFSVYFTRVNAQFPPTAM